MLVRTQIDILTWESVAATSMSRQTIFGQYLSGF